MAALALAEFRAGTASVPDPTVVSLLWKAAREQAQSDGTFAHASPHEQLCTLVDLLEVASALTAANIPVPLSVHALLAHGLRAARLLCRPDGQPHAFRESTFRNSITLERLETLAGSVLVVPIDDTSGMFALPSGGYAGVVTGNEKLIVRSASGPLQRKSRRSPEGVAAIEYCVDDSFVFVTWLSEGGRARNAVRAPLRGWWRHHQEVQQWRVESLPFVFEATDASRSSGLHHRVEQLGAGAWRGMDRPDRRREATRSFCFDAAWQLSPVGGSQFVARNAVLRRAIHLVLAPSDANNPQSTALDVKSKSGSVSVTMESEAGRLTCPVPRGGLTWTIAGAAAEEDRRLDVV